MDSIHSTLYTHRNSEKKTVVGSEPAVYEIRPTDFTGSQFGMEKFSIHHDISNPTSFGLMLQDPFPKFDATKTSHSGHSTCPEMQQHLLPVIPTPRPVDNYPSRPDCSTDQTNAGNSVNFRLSSESEVSQVKPWYWNIDQSSSSLSQTESNFRQHSADNSQIQRQIDPFSSNSWHAEESQLELVLNTDVASTTMMFLPPKPQASSTSQLKSRPKPHSNVVLPVSHAVSGPFSPPILVPGIKHENTTITMQETAGPLFQGQRNNSSDHIDINNSDFMMFNEVSPSVTSEGISQHFNTDSHYNSDMDYDIDYDISPTPTRRQSLNDSPFKDSQEYMNLTAFLPSNIRDFGIRHSFPPTNTLSTVSSPPHSVPSSSTSPSPTISTASSVLPINLQTASTPQLFSYITDRTTPQPVNLTTQIACPLANCLKMFSRISDLEVHFQTSHNLNLREVVLSQTRSKKPLPASVNIEEMAHSASSSQLSLNSDVNSNPISPTSNVKASSSRRDSQSMRIFPCHLCLRVFARKHDLQRHIRVHTGSKPYLCVHCQKPFARTDALSRHYKIETVCQEALSQIESNHQARKQQNDQVQMMLHLEAREIQRAYEQCQKQTGCITPYGFTEFYLGNVNGTNKL